MNQIRLEVPAQPEYGRLARVTVAGLAIRLGFTYRDVEDLRLALDEALIALLDGARTGDVEVVYGLGDDELTVEVVGNFHDGALPVSERAAERFERMVADLVDDAALEAGDFRITLRKERSPS